MPDAEKEAILRQIGEYVRAGLENFTLAWNPGNMYDGYIGFTRYQKCMIQIRASEKRFQERGRVKVVDVHLFLPQGGTLLEQLRGRRGQFEQQNPQDVIFEWKGSNALFHYYVLVDWTHWGRLHDNEKKLVVACYQAIVNVLVNAQVNLGNPVGTGARNRVPRERPAIDLGNYINEAVIGQRLDCYVRRLVQTGQLVLTGAPGTGKSFLARKIASCMTGESVDDAAETPHISMCQFHPSFDYSDFVEGLRPVEKNNMLGYERRDGIFMDFCKKAIEENNALPQGERPKPFVFIIDEINRGDISKIFGELFFAIEKSYRGKKGLKTRYNNLMPADHVFKSGFCVPPNVFIIGTMNDIDRGVESMDFAIRRRFAWMEIGAMSRFKSQMADAGIRGEQRQQIKAVMRAINDKIVDTEGLGAEFCIGPAYFTQLSQEGYGPEDLWNDSISPLLREYLRGMSDMKDIYEDLKSIYDDAWGIDSNEVSETDDDEVDSEDKDGPVGAGDNPQAIVPEEGRAEPAEAGGNPPAVGQEAGGAEPAEVQG